MMMMIIKSPISNPRPKPKPKKKKKKQQQWQRGWTGKVRDKREAWSESDEQVRVRCELELLEPLELEDVRVDRSGGDPMEPVEPTEVRVVVDRGRRGRGRFASFGIDRAIGGVMMTIRIGTSGGRRWWMGGIEIRGWWCCWSVSSLELEPMVLFEQAPDSTEELVTFL